MYRDPKDLSDQAHISAPLAKPKAIQEVATDISNKVVSSDSKNAMECDTSVEELNNTPENKETVINSKELSEEPMLDTIKSEVDEDMSIKEEKTINYSNEPTESFKVFSPKEEKICSKTDISVNIKKDDSSVDQEMELDSNDTAQEEEIGAIHYVRHF